MKGNVFLILFSLLTSIHHAQEITPKQRTIFLELGGSAGLASFNYEKEFKSYPNLSLRFRSGFSYAPIDKNNGSSLISPLMIQGLIGKKNHKLELGIGQGITITTRLHFFSLTTPAIGYRFESPESNWIFRASYTPLISYLIDFQYQHWAGLSVGFKL
jgi:hypothetical protein